MELLRHSSDTDMLQQQPSRVRAQTLLMLIAVLLTVHSVAYLWEHLIGGKQLELASVPRNEAMAIVWCSGWITAATTGLGALPFLCLRRLSHRLIAVCNAVAAGMMLAASIGLVAEGCMEETTPDTALMPAVRLLLGGYLGVGFVRASSWLVGETDAFELVHEATAGTAGGALDMRRAMLIMAVMTVHSFTEGAAVGVSYHSRSLGGFISATLAIHNIPEGIAIACILIPRGFTVLSTALWCIFSSLPQPIMAVPSYLFVDAFRFITPIGYGFSAGAMGFVAIFELLFEAREHISAAKAYSIMLASLFAMGLVQVALRESAYSR